MKSFKHAGITTAFDGSEDLLIKCLAENEDLAREVHRKLYNDVASEDPLQSYTGKEEVDNGGLCLSEESGDEFCGFEVMSFVALTVTACYDTKLLWYLINSLLR